jgi:hypothetical protein
MFPRFMAKKYEDLSGTGQRCPVLFICTPHFL